MAQVRELTVLIVPEGWKRPGGQGRRRFTVKSQRDFQNAVRAAWTDKYAEAPVLDGAIVLQAFFWMPRPKAKMWKKKAMPRYPHTHSPDLSNLLKNIEDALEGLAYRNDAQIYDIRTRKIVVDGHSQPMITIWIEEVLE